MNNNKINENYNMLYNTLQSHYQELSGYDFYNFIFPDNQNQGEMPGDYSKPNAIYLYKDQTDPNPDPNYSRGIMLKDTWYDAFMKHIYLNPSTICGGLSYMGHLNKLDNASLLHALIFDIDSVSPHELNNILLRIYSTPSPNAFPLPTFINISGTGLHLYYVLHQPIELYPYIKTQLNQLKNALTELLWIPGETSCNPSIQYQGINQGFRMPGSINDKYNLPVRAFHTGSSISLDQLNSYVNEDARVNLNQKFKPTEYTLEEAKKLYPEWYEKVIVQKDTTKKNWNINPKLYYWWLRQSDQIKCGYRYNYLLCMAIYAIKCNIPLDELESDMNLISIYLSNIGYNHPITERNIRSALKAYKPEYITTSISRIEKLTGIEIKRNKRNGRTQEEHLKLARASQAKKYPNGEWRGNQSKEQLVKDFIREYPNLSVTEIAKRLNVSRPTVYKYK